MGSGSSSSSGIGDFFKRSGNIFSGSGNSNYYGEFESIKHCKCDCSNYKIREMKLESVQLFNNFL